MNPRMNPSFPPQFHELDEYTFQYLCRDLFEVQESIATCEIYGKRGRQKQYGIDLLAQPKDGSGFEVGQCKCYAKFNPSDIQKASDEFLQHLEYWRKRNVKRFILFVACSLDSTKQQEAIIEQINRFSIIGIAYESWSANTLRQKLGPHREIVGRYVQSDDVIKQICGEIIPPISSHDGKIGERVALEVLGSEIKELSSQLSIEKARWLEEIRKLYREGHQIQALSCIEAILNEPTWSRLEKPLRARVLRVLATYILNLKSDLPKAKSLANQARDFDPDADDSILKTLIVYHENDATSALEMIKATPNIDIFNFQLALLLELRRTDEIISMIEEIPAHIVLNAETRRLHAWALITKGELIGAQKQIQIAITEQPSWQSVRFLAAVIGYLSALSPAVLPSRPIHRPEPIDWSFVKRDRESLNRLRKAEKEFKDLAEKAEPENQEGLIFTSWQLACLSNDPEKQNEAESLCQTLLLEDPTDPIVLIWGASRSFNLNWESSRTALQAYPKQASDYIDKTIALIALFLDAGDSDKALCLLADSKRSFNEKHAIDIWDFWQVQAEIASRRLEDALMTARSCSNKRERFFLEGLALRALATETGNWDKVISHLDNCFKETGDGRFLFEYCQVQARQKDWQEVAGKAEQLMTKIGTQDALRLTTQATWEVKQFDKCLKFLTDYSHLFPDSILPHPLWRLRVLCQAKIGQLSNAVADAEDLARNEPTTQNLLTLMDVQLMKGDLKGLSLTANRLFSHDDVPPKELLRLGRLVIIENLDLARKAWKRAINLGIDDSELGFAIDLAFRLSLEHDLGPLWQRANALIAEGKGPFRSADISELRSWISEKNQNITLINNKYNSAEIPIHFFAERLHLGLSYFFRTLFEGNCQTPDPELQPAILARHGGRALLGNFSTPPASWRLHIDITSFLLAAELGILDEIEQFFKPIRISKHLPVALVFELDRLTAQQPAVLEGYRQILKLFETGKLNPTPPSSAISTILIELTSKMGQHWAAVLTTTLGNNSFLVEFLPLRDNTGNFENISLPAQCREKVTNCRTIIESLRQNGYLSESFYQTVLNDMGNEGSLEPEAILPVPGDTIHLMANTASVLSNANALQKVCEHFKVFIEESFHKEIHHLIAQDKHRDDLVVWLGTLLNRVNMGLESGTYEAFQCQTDHLDGEPSEETIRDYTSLSLLELLRFSPKTEDIICIDDRFTNAHAHRDGAPIISLLELLEVLRVNNMFNQSKFFGIYLRLRMANVRYIPLSSKEICFHLEQAIIVDGLLVETPELLVLRRYLASCLLDINRLQRPPMPSNASNSQGELAFILGTSRAVKEAIIKCWRNLNSNLKSSMIQANWLLENLYTGVFGIRHLLPALDQNSDGLDLIGLDIGGVFSEGISLQGKEIGQTDGKGPRQEYFEWLEYRILLPRLFSEPGAKTAIAQAVHQFFAGMREIDASSPEKELCLKALMQQMYFDIPETIKDELKSDPEFLTYIGVKIVESIKFENLVFTESDFWRAATMAMRGGGSSSANALEPQGRYNFERIYPDSSTGYVIQIKSQIDSREFKFENPMLGLLQGTTNDWEDLMRANRSWFDCESHELEKIIGEVLMATAPQNRVKKVQQCYDKSVAVFYAQLESNIKGSNRFNFSELIPPSADRLLAYHRLRPLREKGNFQQSLGEASRRLLDEEGLHATLQRLICIPVQLTELILERYGSLSDPERQKLLSDIAGTMVSPVCQLHLIFLALKFDGQTSWGVEFSRKAMSALFAPQEGQETFLLFQSLLSWVNDEFSCWADAKTWQSSVKLAMVWAHASHLYNIFLLTGAQPGELLKIFDCKGARITLEFFDRDLSCWNDVLHPTRLNRQIFLVHSLAKLLENIDVEILNQASILERLKEFASKITNGQSFEDLLLLRDSSLAQDNLKSFLGGDCWAYLKKILTSDGSQTFMSPNLFLMTESTLDSLIENHNIGPEWLKLSAFIGDLPIYSKFQNKLKNLLEGIDFEVLFEHDPQAAVLALHFATNQSLSLYTLDEVGKSSLINKVLNLAKKINNQLNEELPNHPSRSQKSQDQVIFLIYDAILSLSIKPKDPRETSKNFSGLLLKLCEVAPFFLYSFRYALNKFVFELPSSHLHGLWPIVLLARARSMK